MAIKRKLIECECGEIFADVRNQLQGELKHGPWRFKTSRLRTQKTANGGDVVACIFERSVECAKCGMELIREKRQYDLTPPVNPSKPEPIPSFFDRELVVSADAPVKKDKDDGIISIERYTERETG